MSSCRAFERLMVLLMAVLLMGCTPQTPVEEVAVATHVVAPRPELTPATLPALTGTPLSTPTATILPVLTETPLLMTPTIPATPTIPPAPTNPPPATPLPPVPVFAGLLRHDLQLHLGGEPSTLSYLTGVGSSTHLDALRDVVAANWGDTRILEEDLLMGFSPNRQLMAFLIGHPIPDDGLGQGRPSPETVVLNEDGNVIGEAFVGHFEAWLPGGEGIITRSYDSASLYGFDGRPPFHFDFITGLRSLWASPDRNTIVYTAQSGGATDLWRMNWDGSNPSLVFTSSDESIRYLSWSSDSNWLAFLMAGRIWVLEPSSSEINSFDVSGIPVWSPDSQRLAVYTQDTIQNNEDVIYLIEPMNGQVTELWVSFPPGNIYDGQRNYITDVIWSPAGEWLAFLLRHTPPDRVTPRTEDVWLIDLAGTALFRLTDDGMLKDALRWLP